MVELQNRIGTIVHDSRTNRGYIIGASDKANDELQKRIDTPLPFDFDLKDAVFLTSENGVYELDLKSENYRNYTLVKGMTGSCFGGIYGNYGPEAQKQVASIVQDYCNGNISDDEIKQALIDMCKDMRVYYTQSGYTSGTNEADNKKIIEDVFDQFQRYNALFMVDKCFRAGKEIAEEYAGGDKLNWVYYDAKYYYESKHLNEILQNAAKELAGQWETTSIDFDNWVDLNSRFTADGKYDFNGVWNWRAEDRGICSVERNWIPDESFSLFYQENKNRVFPGEYTWDSQAGICIVGYGDKKWTMLVPFNGSTTVGPVADHFNVKDLFEKNKYKAEPSLLNLLSKFDVYTRAHGHNKLMAEMNKQEYEYARLKKQS